MFLFEDFESVFLRRRSLTEVCNINYKSGVKLTAIFYTEYEYILSRTIHKFWIFAN